MSQPRPRRRGRWLVLVLLLVALGAVALALINRDAGAQAPRIVVERLQRGPFRREITGTGIVEAARERTLSFQQGGTVAVLEVAEGDQVEAGQTLASLDSAATERELASTRANLQSAQAELRQLQAQQQVDRLEVDSSVATAQDELANSEQTLAEAQSTLTTTERLVAAGAASESELQSDQNAVQQAQRALERARIALESAQTRDGSFGGLADAERSSRLANIATLETTIANLTAQQGEATLNAPFAGVVSRVTFEVGDQVGAAEGGIELVDLSNLSVEASFDENRALELAAEQPATITPDANTALALDATVARVSPVARREEGAAEISARLTFDASAAELIETGRIRPGYTVTTRVTINALDDVVLVPLEAITETDGVSFVYRVLENEPGAGVVEQVEVAIQDRNATFAAVAGNLLDEGEMIAVLGLDALQDGTEVQYSPPGPTRETDPDPGEGSG